MQLLVLYQTSEMHILILDNWGETKQKKNTKYQFEIDIQLFIIKRKTEIVNALITQSQSPILFQQEIIFSP